MPSIELIEQVIAEEKENCQRKVNQGVLKEDQTAQDRKTEGVRAMTNLVTQTRFLSLQKYWRAEADFSIPECRQQFHNAFIAALSGLSDELVWEAALKAARETVLKNLNAKMKKDANGGS